MESGLKRWMNLVETEAKMEPVTVTKRGGVWLVLSGRSTVSRHDSEALANTKADDLRADRARRFAKLHDPTTHP